MAKTRYIWDPVNDTYLMEKDAAGSTTAVYTNEPGPYGPLMSQRRGGQTNYYHFDGQGSTRQMTDASQNVTDSARYSAFGEVLGISGSTTNPFGYKGAIGYYVNAQSPELYVRARELATNLGRWTSLDPVGFSYDTNLYRYVASRPLDMFDPTGLSTSWTDVGKSSFCSTVAGPDSYVFEICARHRDGTPDGYIDVRIKFSISNKWAKCCKETKFVQVVNGGIKSTPPGWDLDGADNHNGVWEAPPFWDNNGHSGSWDDEEHPAHTAGTDTTPAVMYDQPGFATGGFLMNAITCVMCTKGPMAGTWLGCRSWKVKVSGKWGLGHYIQTDGSGHQSGPPSHFTGAIPGYQEFVDELKSRAEPPGKECCLKGN